MWYGTKTRLNIGSFFAALEILILISTYVRPSETLLSYPEPRL